MDFPSVRLHCYGRHVVTELGRPAETKKVIDFDFVIDLALSMKLGPGALYTYEDDVMAYRGGMVRWLKKLV
jgi:hypothetical protein